jgi:prepilin-type processing-associated H-X9-DG protein
MKYLKTIIFSVGSFFIANIAFADGSIDDPTVKSPIKSVSDIQTWIVEITKWGFTIFFILAVAFILLAAYRYLMARDNETEVKKATASLKNAVIAIAIALVSAGVSSIVNSVLKIGQ